jgi:hypothetical protein
MYKILAVRCEGKRPLVRSRGRCENIRMDLKKVGWEDVNWIYVAQDKD